MNSFSRYDIHEDLSQGIREKNHPEILLELKRWAELDEGDPARWAKRRMSGDQYSRKIGRDRM